LLTDKIWELPTGDEESGVKIKIVDFGIFGSNAGNTAEKSTAGSLKYMAPELLSGRTHSTPAIDVWSMGCILHALVLGTYPFEANDRDELKKQILTKEIKVATKANRAFVSNACLVMIEKMLDKEPNTRISIHALLHDPWLMDYKLSKKL